jgi:hypothetical protein
MKGKKANKQYYNRTNTCDICHDNLYSGNARKEHNEKGDWTGRWLCEKCGNRHRQRLPNSQNNIIKSLRDRRIGNLDPNSSAAKGDLFEDITYKTRGIKILSIEEDNYRLPLEC